MRVKTRITSEKEIIRRKEENDKSVPDRL